MNKVRVYKKLPPKPKLKSAELPPDKPKTLVGKTVKYTLKCGGDSVPVIGVVKHQEGATVDIAAAIPNQDGALFVAKDAAPFRVSADSVEVVEVEALLNRDVKAFQTNDPIENVKAASEVKEDGVVVDYRNVTFEGYGSTFRSTTPADRDGDYIMEHAFDRSLARFRENPVMLIDHERSVKAMMGHYERVGITERGLALIGKVTNSPHHAAVHTRFQIVEGSLKTLSIGGFFYYLEDYRGIEEIDLHEVSLVVIPANPDAHFQVRAINEEVVAKAFIRHMNQNGGQLRLKAT